MPKYPVDPWFEPGATVLVIDPGQTSGVCVGGLHLSAPPYFHILHSGAFRWGTRFETVLLLFTEYRPTVVILEQFTLYANKARDQIGSHFPSAEVIGIAETRAYDFGLLNRVIKQPASVMAMVKIEEEHAPQIVNSEHARDAYKHLRYYVLQNMAKRRRDERRKGTQD